MTVKSLWVYSSVARIEKPPICTDRTSPLNSMALIQRQLFSPPGELTSVVVMREADGASRGFRFVNFEKPECICC